MNPEKGHVRKIRSIQVKIGIIIISLTTLILALFGAYQYWQIQTQKETELTRLADTAAAQLAENLVMPMWNYQKTDAEKVLLSEMQNRNVYAVLIRNAYSDDMFIGTIRDDEWHATELEHEVADIGIMTTHDIVKGEDTLGTVEVYVAQRFLREELRREVVELAAVVLVLDLAIVIVLASTLRILLLRPLHTLLITANNIADGDLTQDIAFRQQDEIGALATAFQKMVTQLRDVTQRIREATDNVTNGSQQMSSSAAQMSQGAAEQAAATEEASSSMEEMAANIRQNADNAKQTEQIALQAAKEAKKSGKAVSKTVKAMRKIAREVALIEDFSGKTRLLSLNATIEASRAGESGKGFAVVAAHVRELADGTTKLAENIKTLVNSSVTVAEQAGTRLKHLLPDIQKTAELVQEISAASGEQSSGAQQINRAIQQLDQVTQQNSATSEELSATAEELAAQAEQLRDTIAFFKIDEDAEQTPETAPTDAVTARLESKDTPTLQQPRNGNGTPSGIMLDFEKPEIERDSRDDEFERY